MCAEYLSDFGFSFEYLFCSYDNHFTNTKYLESFNQNSCLKMIIRPTS